MYMLVNEAVSYLKPKYPLVKAKSTILSNKLILLKIVDFAFFEC